MSDVQSAPVEFNRHSVDLLDPLTVLSELTALSIHALDEPQLLGRALEALMSNRDMARCSIYLLDQEGVLSHAAGLAWDDMLRGSTRAEADAAPSGQTPCRLGEGIMGRAAATGLIEHCSACADDPRVKPFAPGAAPVQGALMCVPIRSEERVLGVLNVFHPRAGFFTVWHERLLHVFCQVLGRLLLNHRFTHHLGALLDARTRDVIAANKTLREEAVRRQKAQDKLQHQHGFLQSVLDGAPEPIMVIGLDYRLLMANAPARQNAPLNAEESWTCHQLSHHRDTPCDSAGHQCPLQMVIERDGPARVVHEHFDGEGEVRLIELLASPLRDEDGAIIGIIESARDITERMRVETELREAKDYAENLVRTANVMVVELDGDGGLVVFNPAAEAVSGYSMAELAGRNWFEVLCPRQRYPRVWVEFERLMKGGMPERFENPILTKSGEERYIVWQNSVLHRHGKAASVVSFGMDITERKQSELRIRQLAYYDTLTDLPNRRLLQDRLNHALAQAKRFQRSLAVMFLDLDRFKQINDTLGHDAGDELLKQVAGRLNTCVRAGDTVSRPGGDEFVVVLAEISQAHDAALVAEKIIAALDEPIAVLGQALNVTTSIGIAVYPVDGTDDIQELMRKADLAMYQAKEAGRNGYRFYRD